MVNNISSILGHINFCGISCPADVYDLRVLLLVIWLLSYLFRRLNHSINLYIHLSVHPSIHLFIHLSIYLILHIRWQRSIDKRISYRKQIVRHHSCQKFWPGQGGGGRPCKNFLLSSLITKQYLVIFSYRVSACRTYHKFFWCWGSDPWLRACRTPGNTLFHHVC